MLSQRPGLGTKADLCVELKKLEQYVPSLGSLTVNPEKFSKAAIAKELVSVRTVAFSKVPTAKAEIEESVRNAFVTTTTVETSTAEIEKQKYYTYKDCTLWENEAIIQNIEFPSNFDF